MRVLLIEDDPSLCTFYSRALGRVGGEITVANRGDDGLHLAETLSFDVIVLDWYLPGLDGISVLKELRAIGLAVPVLVLSGSGELGRDQAVAAGANAFLGKPCGLEELTTQVAKLVHQANLPNPVVQAA